MNTIDIEMKIREYVQLYGQNAKGWESCVHNTCDHGKKGPRAAFKFNTHKILFNCFNCGNSAVLDLDGKYIPTKFRAVLEDFGMPKRTLDTINFQLLNENGKIGNGTTKRAALKSLKINPKPITLPRDFVMLEGNEDTDVGKLALNELERRKIAPDSYPFMLCIKSPTKSREKWNRRLVIPTFKDNDVIFYQAQDLTGNAEAKYLNASGKDVDRSRIISNYDVIFEKSDDPIYIVEGWYDAFHINGVAIFGNQLKDEQLAWLNKSYREKVFIPDRSGDGADVAMRCIELGWKVSVPYKNLQDGVKDVSDMVSTYGLLFTLKRLKESTSTSEFDGENRIAQLTI